MSYANIAAITQSGSLYQRLTAAAAEEGKNPTSPGAWVSEHIWELASSPGWADAWASAVENGVADPGANEAVITDGMILAAVQPIGAPEPPAPLTITAIEPSSASITDADFEGHIRGTGFTEDSVIIWNGAEEPTRFVDSTDIWTTVVPSVVTAPTTVNVHVVSDGQATGILPFTWTA